MKLVCVGPLRKPRLNYLKDRLLWVCIYAAKYSLDVGQSCPDTRSQLKKPRKNSVAIKVVLIDISLIILTRKRQSRELVQRSESI